MYFKLFFDKKEKYVTMYLAKEFVYNKKGIFDCRELNVFPKIIW